LGRYESHWCCGYGLGEAPAGDLSRRRRVARDVSDWSFDRDGGRHGNADWRGLRYDSRTGSRRRDCRRSARTLSGAPHAEHGKRQDRSQRSGRGDGAEPVRPPNAGRSRRQATYEIRAGQRTGVHRDPRSHDAALRALAHVRRERGTTDPVEFGQVGFE